MCTGFTLSDVSIVYTAARKKRRTYVPHTHLLWNVTTRCSDTGRNTCDWSVCLFRVLGPWTLGVWVIPTIQTLFWWFSPWFPSLQPLPGCRVGLRLFFTGLNPHRSRTSQLCPMRHLQQTVLGGGSCEYITTMRPELLQDLWHTTQK